MLLKLLSGYKNLLHPRFISVRINTFRREKLCTQANSIDTTAPDTISEKLVRKTSVRKYVEQRLLPEVVEKFPPGLLRKKKLLPSLGYLIDNEVAETLYEHLKQENINTSGIAFEVNPGPGLLTKQLLRLGFTSISCADEYASVADGLKGIDGVKIVGNQYTVHDIVRCLLCYDAVKGDKLMQEILRPGASNQIYIFGTATNRSFPQLLIRFLAQESLFFDPRYKLKNPICYLLLGPGAYETLTCGPSAGYSKYLSGTVLFQTFFKCTVITAVDRKSIIPWEKEVKNKNDEEKVKSKIRVFGVSADSAFVKLEINQENIAKLGKQNLHHFRFFVKHNLIRRTNAVIPQLEKYEPNCGLKLIRKGLTIYTPFGDLTPQEILDLYLEFMSWSGIESSPFFCLSEETLDHLDEASRDKKGALKYRRQVALHEQKKGISAQQT